MSTTVNILSVLRFDRGTRYNVIMLDDVSGQTKESKEEEGEKEGTSMDMKKSWQLLTHTHTL